METRKVQRTGKSTFIVSLPKSWATNHGIQAGSIIYINQSDNGSLVLTPERSEQDLRRTLEIGTKAGEPLMRDLIGCYVSGYRTIELTSQHMTPAQKKDIHQIIGKLIGPEILEETISKVLIQDLLSSEELQAERGLRRIRTVVKSMIQDSIAALVTHNRELAFDVLQRDDDVDRLYLLISRQFTEILRNGSGSDSLDPITAFNYMQVALNLERMADHAYGIAEVVVEHQFSLPDDLVSQMSELEPIFASLIDDSISSLLNKKVDRANEVIEKTRELRRHVPILADTTSSNSCDKEELTVRILVASSIERMLDHITNIGELTINLTHASLGSEAD